MKNATKYMLGLALPVLISSAAFADTASPDGNLYAALSGNVTWMHHTNTGGGGNAALGFRLWPGDFGAFRGEGEIGYHAASNDSGVPGRTRYVSYMANMYYDLNKWRFGSGFTPYVGAGIGVADAKFRAGNRDDVFAYQGMVGVSFTPASATNTDWYLGYRYVGSSRADNGGIGSNRLNAHNAELGVRFHL